MKRIFLPLLILFFAFSAYPARPALAQDENPPVGPVGDVRGTVINRNSGKVVTQSLEVMLHILDMNLVDQGMEHGQSNPDGTFVFADIPFNETTQFAVMATYDGVSYFSETTPADMKSMRVSIDMPVYETTTDLSAVQIDQMHVLFEFSTDGLETKELYIVSNTGERTVKDVYDLGEGKSAALQFPLPEDADYIFFKPDDQDRFVKLNGTFADTYPILPGGQPAQIMTSYLLPFSGERVYTYTAPVSTAKINFILPDQPGISLQGEGLVPAEPTTLQDGTLYQVYSYSYLKAGEKLSVTLTGTLPIRQSTNTYNNLIAAGAAFLGFAIIGVGVWWWRKPEETQTEEEEASAQSDQPALDTLIAEIALLDEAHEQGELSLEDHQAQRKKLVRRAKQLL